MKALVRLRDPANLIQGALNLTHRQFRTSSSSSLPRRRASGRIVPRTILEHAGHVQPDAGSSWGTLAMSVAGHHVCHRDWAPAFVGEVKKE
jgi:hypothetical protein